MDCPSTECHKRVEGHQKTLYGEDGRSGVVVELEKKVNYTCIKKYMPKPSTAFIVLFLTFAVLPTVGTGFKVWFGQETSSYVYADKKKVQNHEQRLLVLEQGIGYMTSEMGEVKEAVKDQKKDIKEQFAEQKKEVKEEFNEIKQMIRAIP